jgi:hypothetical protein
METLAEPKVVYVGQGTSTLRTDKDFEVALTVEGAMEDVTTRCCFLAITLLPGVRVQKTDGGFLVEGGGVYTELGRTEASLSLPGDHPKAIPTGTYKPPTFTSVVATYGPKKAGRRWKMPRKMTRRYCKKTPCKRMGFTQRASCRPWKNCY